uniref:Uncharacterized protein n=1 Tax=Microplitis mediator bracovirus TaxID=1836595 RepID=A0A2I6SGV0_9VIRU|nr:hypothetical protein MmBV_CMP3 [Microplitis mediator bracovirus]
MTSFHCLTAICNKIKQDDTRGKLCNTFVVVRIRLIVGK